ncbi:hypothetical protein [uncultured Pseudodesulfovibrio sp.]|uniref:hypothetical protein n=1 Tax=uncultured Pseudodesulfovibrio sp. TaxID=2035858 RepID=UPI0029C99B41|nr:hypothetical protein [uncultured Pseudodesulfovibrio sp.]
MPVFSVALEMGFFVFTLRGDFCGNAFNDDERFSVFSHHVLFVGQDMGKTHKFFIESMKTVSALLGFDCVGFGKKEPPDGVSGGVGCCVVYSKA